MATSHFTENLSPASCHSLDAALNIPSKHEKISCSFSDISSIDPLDLVGHHVIFEEYLPSTSHSASEIISYGCTVVGFIHAFPSIGVQSQLVYCLDGDSYHETALVSRLTVKALDRPYLEP
ncbi:hypothetical protein ALP72_01318 [Pseudomonas coronafaciens pv. coronafaciens]|uniref:hypothetical protein n=1 Tax=Pseudomonas coronafaciens TaxID=53409 RepID=UPI000F40BE63|nr:hypothetical protein [Pseudomonas coronafaciens]RMS10654.1 hypothetical protein ALP72_01318 [Pseudomonas coronafaciens pv. coronafaciens]